MASLNHQRQNGMTKKGSDLSPPPAESAVQRAMEHDASGREGHAWTELESALASQAVFIYAFEQLANGTPPETIQLDLLARGFGVAVMETQIQQAIASLRDECLAQITAGAIWMSREEPRRAEEKFRCAIELNPHHPHILKAWDLLGCALLNQGRYTQALATYDTLLTLDPDHPTAKQSRRAVFDLISPLADQEETNQSARRIQYTRIPETLESMTDLDQAIAEHILNHIKRDALSLTPHTKTVTIGSCFAASVARALTREGIPAINLTVGEEANSTFSNRMIVESALQGEKIPEKWLPKGYGDHEVVRSLFTSDLLIYTLGVAPCFFDRQTGQFVPTNGAESVRGVARGQTVFRNTTVEENVINLLAMVDAIRSKNPDCRFVFSLSPVPLYATLERRSVIEADCLSKSILRVAIEQVVSSRPHCLYWPAFEMVRWLGAYFSGMYGQEDGSLQHVSEEVVQTIMRHFIRLFQAKGPSPRANSLDNAD